MAVSQRRTSAEIVRQGGPNVVALPSAAESVGLAMNFARITRQPNTLAAHALIDAMPVGPAQDAMVEALFRAYFVDGADLGSRETLFDIAEPAGLPRDAARHVIDDRHALDAIARSDGDTRRNGVTAVPLFVVDHRLAVHGAQGADAILAAFDSSTHMQDVDES